MRGATAAAYRSLTADTRRDAPRATHAVTTGRVSGVRLSTDRTPAWHAASAASAYGPIAWTVEFNLQSSNVTNTVYSVVQN